MRRVPDRSSPRRTRRLPARPGRRRARSAIPGPCPDPTSAAAHTLTGSDRRGDATSPHRSARAPALEALVRAQANLTRRLAADLERIGVSATGFTMLVLLTSAGGRLELRTMRRRLGASKATATEVLDTLEKRGFVGRSRLESDRRAVAVALTQAGFNLVTHAFPAHAERVREAFGMLDETEKRQLADLCRKLDRAAQPAWLSTARPCACGRRRPHLGLPASGRAVRERTPCRSQESARQCRRSAG